MRRVPICFLAFLGAAAPALAQYHFDSWTTDNGLPHNSINSMLQSHDGYLWLATPDGLVRFDGVRFTSFTKSNTPGIKSNRFTAIYEDRDGTLWIGTESAGVTRYRDGSFTTFSTDEWSGHELVRGIAGGRGGSSLGPPGEPSHSVDR